MVGVIDNGFRYLNLKKVCFLNVDKYKDGICIYDIC